MQIQLDRRCIIVLLLLSLLKATIVNSCFITNCPSGGKKRSESLTFASRKCPPCGPLGMGQCFGPSLCCGQFIGCHLNTPDSQVCKMEDSDPSPCLNDVPHCLSVHRGFCATNGVCCNGQGECKQEELCQIEKHMASPSPTFNWKRLSLSTGLRIQPELEKTIPKPHSNTMAYREALSLMRTTPKYSATNNYFPLGEYVK